MRTIDIRTKEHRKKFKFKEKEIAHMRLKKYKEGLFTILTYTLFMYAGLLELLPITYFFLIRVAFKKKSFLEKIIVSFTIPFLFFFPLNLWKELPIQWYIIPSLVTGSLYFIFFLLSYEINKTLSKLKIQNKLINILLISILWILVLKFGGETFGTDFLWMPFSIVWHKSILSKLNIFYFEFIVFFIISYFSIALEIKKKKHIISSTILLILLASTFFIPRTIDHELNALLVNLNLDLPSQYRDQHQNEILGEYLREIELKIKNDTNFVLLPEFVIVKDWRSNPEIIDKIRDLSIKINAPILIGAREDYNKTHFFTVLLYIDENKTLSLKDPYPMPLQTNVLRGKGVPVININGKKFAYLGCFSAYQTRFWKIIKNNNSIDGTLISSNEQAPHMFVRELEYYGTRYLEKYSGKPVYKSTNTGTNYPEEFSNSPNNYYGLSDFFN